MRRVHAQAERGRALLRFFDYALGEGARSAAALGHVPLPGSVSDFVRCSWPRLAKGPDERALWQKGPSD